MSKEIDIEYYHQLALQKQKEHRKILANLKKKPPKNLDKIAQQIHQEVFEEIDQKVRVRFGLIDADEEAEVSTPERTGKITENIEEVTLELDDAIEIEE